MKKTKRFASLLLALVMVFAMAVTASANETTAHTITITNDKSGHTYEAYQIFKGTISDGKLVNISWGNGVKSNDLLTALKTDTTIGTLFDDAETAEDVADIISAFNATQTDIFAEIVGKNLETVAGTSTEENSLYTINVTGDGYYLVKDKDDSVTTTEDAYTKYILQVVGNVTVNAKADAPSLEKKIVENNTKVDANNGSIGDTVNYELTSKVPDMDGYDKYYFIVHDTLSKGLTFGNDVAITVGEKTLAKDTDFTVTTTTNSDGSTEIKIVFINFIQYTAEQDIVIQYSATINENAIIGNVGNPNTAYLEYSNNPNKEQNGVNEPGNGDVTGKTPEDYTITYVTGIELIKVDENDNRLTGAEFKITGTKLNKVKIVTETFKVAEDGTYYKLKDGTYTETAPTNETIEKYESTTIKYTMKEVVTWKTKTEEVSVTATVGADGVLRFDGLGEGTYVIEEITAPDGYNLLKDEITVTITCTEPETVTAATDEATWKYTLSGAITADEATATDGRIHITVENKSGATLPETGGTGTTVFYILGGILMVAAAILLVTKRRMNTNR